MNKIVETDITFADGIKPVFTQADIKKLASETWMCQYHKDAYRLVDNYKRNELPWEIMSKRQREWLWKIKDDLEKRR